MFVGTVAGISKFGEGKVPIEVWLPRVIEFSKGVILIAEGDYVDGVVTLVLLERKAAGDPNHELYSRIWNGCGDDIKEEDFEAVMKWVGEEAIKAGVCTQ